MSGKSEKKLNRRIRKHLRVDYNRFLKEVRELDLNQRLNVSLALYFKVDTVWVGKLILALICVAFIGLGIAIGIRLS